MARRKSRAKASLATCAVHQTPLERRLCNAICLCQLVSILSGVALIYLCFIVIKPSQETLAAEFESTPAVCTTLESGMNEPCPRPSCAEWCLSNGGSSCSVVNASVRRPGATVALRGCQLSAAFCSEQPEEAQQAFICSEGEQHGQCSHLERFFNCSPIVVTRRVGFGVRAKNTSVCRNITARYECRGEGPSVALPLKHLPRCDIYFCNSLDGVYECRHGVCRQLARPRCRERCSDLRPLALFCTRLRSVADGELLGEDCLNGTLVQAAEFARLRSYRDVRETLRRHASPVDRVPTASDVNVFNRSQVMINIQGCVNTLRQECDRWLEVRGPDGRDGRHPAVYPCHVTPHADDYVVTDYDKRQTVHQMVLAATLPSCLLVFSCLCLILCGKMVAVNEFGVFFCRHCHREDGTGRRG
ncbi:uncharacterized protein LOC119103081 [Pollicipes pollicipes]|uniref:uncharacterized protein LOC119103081 n=1 Tax=Pollicipes pollicipes TaxID=41117 RepID=UPI0018853552|nr:uncharacterized protein LOC119103081 [Pollicipes pollicipes]